VVGLLKLQYCVLRWRNLNAELCMPQKVFLKSVSSKVMKPFNESALCTLINVSAIESLKHSQKG
jgi:hypothetical protein